MNSNQIYPYNVKGHTDTDQQKYKKVIVSKHDWILLLVFSIGNEDQNSARLKKRLSCPRFHSLPPLDKPDSALVLHFGLSQILVECSYQAEMQVKQGALNLFQFQSRLTRLFCSFVQPKAESCGIYKGS